MLTHSGTFHCPRSLWVLVLVPKVPFVLETRVYLRYNSNTNHTNQRIINLRYHLVFQIDTDMEIASQFGRDLAVLGYR